jgi:hypothetical protein
MSNKKIPGLSVTDGFDFVKKIWGSLPIPSVMNPTTDLDELDKRISDLKAVEQWLNVNLSMLRATIQGLEVQRGTIATIKSFSSNLGLGAEKTGEISQSVQEEFIRNAMKAVAVPPPMPRVEPVATRVPEVEPSPEEAASSAAQDSSSAMISNATAWWGLLQDQFNKVAAAAITGAGLNTAESGDSADSTTPQPTSKPAASKARNTTASSGAGKKSTGSTRTTRSRT